MFSVCSIARLCVCECVCVRAHTLVLLACVYVLSIAATDHHWDGQQDVGRGTLMAGGLGGSDAVNKVSGKVEGLCE